MREQSVSRSLPTQSVIGLRRFLRKTIMGKGILLWLLGIPIPIIILILLVWH
jgi:hypothetical protein